MTNEIYNGWTNRETWLVNLWITNDEATYDTVRDIVRMANSDKAESLPCDALESFVDEMQEDLDMKPSMFSDLITAALARVNWREIAESLGEE